MKVGTKSILFGAHQFLLHPIILFVAWWQLYGFPVDPRLWVAFVVHDLGYWGKAAMDDAEGETHPTWGALLMGRWFGEAWYWFCLLHSRFYCKRLNLPYSRLCVADKWAIVIDPWWLYLPRAWASRELGEYMRIAEGKEGTKYSSMGMSTRTPREWHRTMVAYMRAWVIEHIDLREDTWTPTVAA